MEEATFDIFSGEPDKDVRWIEAAEGLTKARERIEQIAAARPGKYFLFSPGRSSIILQIDTLTLAAIRTSLAPAEDPNKTNLEDSWRKPYEEAILEVQPEQLHRKLEAAETAIFFRLQELAGQANHRGERQALKDASLTLRSIQVERVNFPKFPKEKPREV